MKRFLITLTTTVLVATASWGQATTTTRIDATVDTVTVGGNGKATVTPDRFSFNVGVQTVASTVDEAVNQNNTKVANVIRALKTAGARDGDIQTSNFSIWPQQDYQEGKLPRILGYQVSNNITVRSSKVADAGRLLGIAVNAGVNTSSGINFEVADRAKGRDEGLRAAFEDAKAKASLLAQAAGRTLGSALMIVEGGQSAPPPYPMPRAMAMEAKAVSDVPVEAGSEERAYSVTVTFQLR
jgi:uncharacterized protein YggE